MMVVMLQKLLIKQHLQTNYWRTFGLFENTVVNFDCLKTKTQIKDLEREAESCLQRSISRIGPERTFARFGVMPLDSCHQNRV